MGKKIRDIVDNIKNVYMTDSNLTTLMDFERVIDELDLYAFKNWKQGELVEGPVYERYFVTCTFMWPYKFMPDPDGATRLLDYGCEVRFKKDMLEYPVTKLVVTKTSTKRQMLRELSQQQPQQLPRVLHQAHQQEHQQHEKTKRKPRVRRSKAHGS